MLTQMFCDMTTKELISFYFLSLNSLFFPCYDLLAHRVRPERSHPAGHRLRCGKPQLQTGQRCSHAGLLCGGERLPS